MLYDSSWEIGRRYKVGGSRGGVMQIAGVCGRVYTKCSA